MNFLKLIESEGYITISKELARNLGLDESLILAELISKYNYWKENDKLTKEGYFYVTIKDLKHETTLTKYRQTKAINNLKDLGLIKTKKQGLPAKRYFTICVKEIKKLFFDIGEIKKSPHNPCHSQEVKNSKTCDGKNGKLVSENSPQLIINNKNNNNETKKQQQRTYNDKNIYKSAEDNGFDLNHSIKVYLDELCKDYGKKMVKMALCESSLRGNTKIVYLTGILKNWKKNKIELSQANPFYKEDYKNKKGNNSLDTEQLKENGWN